VDVVAEDGCAVEPNKGVVVCAGVAEGCEPNSPPLGAPPKLVPTAGVVVAADEPNVKGDEVVAGFCPNKLLVVVGALDPNIPVPVEGGVAVEPNNPPELGAAAAGIDPNALLD